MDQNIPLDRWNKYLYRGQADAEWKLISSSMRELFKNESSHSIEIYVKTLCAEFENIKETVALPNFKKQINSVLSQLDLESIISDINPKEYFKEVINIENWPSGDYLRLSMFLQHRVGLTSVLDWTRHPSPMT